MRTKLLIFPHLLIAALSAPMALGLVRPNRIYGMRTAETLASAEAWYAANYWAGLTGVVLGLVSAVFVIFVMKSRSMTERTKALVAGGAAVFVALAAAAAGMLAA